MTQVNKKKTLKTDDYCQIHGKEGYFQVVGFEIPSAHADPDAVVDRQVLVRKLMGRDMRLRQKRQQSTHPESKITRLTLHDLIAHTQADYKRQLNSLRTLANPEQAQQIQEKLLDPPQLRPLMARRSMQQDYEAGDEA